MPSPLSPSLGPAAAAAAPAIRTGGQPTPSPPTRAPPSHRTATAAARSQKRRDKPPHNRRVPSHTDSSIGAASATPSLPPVAATPVPPALAPGQGVVVAPDLPPPEASDSLDCIAGAPVSVNSVAHLVHSLTALLARWRGRSLASVDRGVEGLKSHACAFLARAVPLDAAFAGVVAEALQLTATPRRDLMARARAERVGIRARRKDLALELGLGAEESLAVQSGASGRAPEREEEGSPRTVSALSLSATHANPSTSPDSDASPPAPLHLQGDLTLYGTPQFLTRASNRFNLSLLGWIRRLFLAVDSERRGFVDRAAYAHLLLLVHGILMPPPQPPPPNSSSSSCSAREAVRIVLDDFEEDARRWGVPLPLSLSLSATSVVAEAVGGPFDRTQVKGQPLGFTLAGFHSVLFELVDQWTPGCDGGEYGAWMGRLYAQVTRRDERGERGLKPLGNDYARALEAALNAGRGGGAGGGGGGLKRASRSIRDRTGRPGVTFGPLAPDGSSEAASQFRERSSASSDASSSSAPAPLQRHKHERRTADPLKQSDSHLASSSSSAASATAAASSHSTATTAQPLDTVPSAAESKGSTAAAMAAATDEEEEEGEWEDYIPSDDEDEGEGEGEELKDGSDSDGGGEEFQANHDEPLQPHVRAPSPAADESAVAPPSAPLPSAPVTSTAASPLRSPRHPPQAQATARETDSATVEPEPEGLVSPLAHTRTGSAPNIMRPVVEQRNGAATPATTAPASGIVTAASPAASPSLATSSSSSSSSSPAPSTSTSIPTSARSASSCAFVAPSPPLPPPPPTTMTKIKSKAAVSMTLEEEEDFIRAQLLQAKTALAGGAGRRVRAHAALLPSDEEDDGDFDDLDEDDGDEGVGIEPWYDATEVEADSERESALHVGSELAMQEQQEQEQATAAPGDEQDDSPKRVLLHGKRLHPCTDPVVTARKGPVRELSSERWGEKAASAAATLTATPAATTSAAAAAAAAAPMTSFPSPTHTSAVTATASTTTTATATATVIPAPACTGDDVTGNEERFARMEALGATPALRAVVAEEAQQEAQVLTRVSKPRVTMGLVRTPTSPSSTPATAPAHAPGHAPAHARAPSTGLGLPPHRRGHRVQRSIVAAAARPSRPSLSATVITVPPPPPLAADTGANDDANRDAVAERRVALLELAAQSDASAALATAAATAPADASAEGGDCAASPGDMPLHPTPSNAPLARPRSSPSSRPPSSFLARPPLLRAPSHQRHRSTQLAHCHRGQTSPRPHATTQGEGAPLFVAAPMEAQARQGLKPLPLALALAWDNASICTAAEPNIRIIHSARQATSKQEQGNRTGVADQRARPTQRAQGQRQAARADSSSATNTTQTTSDGARGSQAPKGTHPPHPSLSARTPAPSARALDSLPSLSPLTQRHLEEFGLSSSFLLEQQQHHQQHHPHPPPSRRTRSVGDVHWEETQENEAQGATMMKNRRMGHTPARSEGEGSATMEVRADDSPRPSALTAPSCSSARDSSNEDLAFSAAPPLDASPHGITQEWSHARTLSDEALSSWHPASHLHRAPLSLESTPSHPFVQRRATHGRGRSAELKPRAAAAAAVGYFSAATTSGSSGWVSSSLPQPAEEKHHDDDHEEQSGRLRDDDDAPRRCTTTAAAATPLLLHELSGSPFATLLSHVHAHEGGVGTFVFVPPRRPTSRERWATASRSSGVPLTTAPPSTTMLMMRAAAMRTHSPAAVKAHVRVLSASGHAVRPTTSSSPTPVSSHLSCPGTAHSSGLRGVAPSPSPSPSALGSARLQLLATRESTSPTVGWAQQVKAISRLTRDPAPNRLTLARTAEETVRAVHRDMAITRHGSASARAHAGGS